MNKCDVCDLPPYYCENMRCKEFSIYDIYWLTAYLSLAAKLNESEVTDDAFGEDDRIWENGIEIK